MSKKIPYADDVPAPTVAIRARLAELLQARHDVTKSAAAKAAGIDPSVLTKVLKGERDLNDITQIVRLARFFSVTVGYLIGETPRVKEPVCEALQAACEDLDSERRALVLNLALSLPKAPRRAVADEAAAVERPTPRRTRGR